MRRTRITPRGIVVSIVFLLFVASIATYLPLTLLTPLHATKATAIAATASTEKAAALTWPGYGGGAITALGYPQSTTTNGSTKPQSIASISKIITSLVVLDKKPLALGDTGPSIIFGAADVALIAKYASQNGKTVKVVAGRTITQHDLLSVALIASANNYADSLAIWAFGSEAAFVTATKAWLSANGLTQTTIVEPTGINARNTSTPTDLIKIGQLALANPTLASIVAMPTFTLDGIGTITNSNLLLGQDGVDGIKTGTLTDSDLLFSADYVVGTKTIVIVGAILGAPNHKVLDVAVKALIKTVQQGFHNLEIARVGQSFAQYSTQWETRADAVASKTTSVVVWSNPTIAHSVSVKSLHTGDKGEQVGTVAFTVDGRKITVDLELDRDITSPDAWWRFSHPAAVLGIG